MKKNCLKTWMVSSWEETHPMGVVSGGDKKKWQPTLETLCNKGAAESSIDWTWRHGDHAQKTETKVKKKKKAANRQVKVHIWEVTNE